MLMPLFNEEAALLARCEETIAAGLADFLRVGEALLTISHSKLYRETHRTFEEYCRQRWGLSRRTAHHKIQLAETYKNVQDLAHFPPANEYQVTQLLPLPTPELQRMAWQRAVAAGGNLSAALVRDAVRAVQHEAAGEPLAACLLSDRVFPGIPYRWEVCAFANRTAAINETPELLLADLTHLPRTSSPSERSALSDSSDQPPVTLPTVLLSPDLDFLPDAPLAYLRHLMAVLAAAATYRFLLWSEHADAFRNIHTWPDNVEMGLRVTTRAALAALPNTDATHASPRVDFLWLAPREPLPDVGLFPYPRLLLGAAPGTLGKQPLDRATCRHYLAAALATSCAIHLAAGMPPLLL